MTVLNRMAPVASLLASVALATAMSACAPLVVGGVATTAIVATDRRTSGAQLEDEGIELRAANRLREALGDDRGHVNITSSNRQVLITGEVPTEADRLRVAQMIAQVDNVRGVVNEVAVLGNASLSQRASDSLVTGRVKASLVDARDLSANAVKVVTERGSVYLMGLVTQRESDRVTQIARTVQGSQRVVRMFEVISEAELARLQPPPKAPAQQPNTQGN